jgi:hypothetical protein
MPPACGTYASHRPAPTLYRHVEVDEPEEVGRCGHVDKNTPHHQRQIKSELASAFRAGANAVSFEGDHHQLHRGGDHGNEDGH